MIWRKVGFAVLVWALDAAAVSVFFGPDPAAIAYSIGLALLPALATAGYLIATTKGRPARLAEYAVAAVIGMVLTGALLYQRVASNDLPGQP